MFKRLLGFIIALLLLVVSGGAVLAATKPYNAIPDRNPAFQDSGRGSIENVHNKALRFGKGGRIAIPGNIPDDINDNSAVSPYSGKGSGGIVAPPALYE